MTDQQPYIQTPIRAYSHTSNHPPCEWNYDKYKHKHAFVRTHAHTQTNTYVHMHELVSNSLQLQSEYFTENK